MKLLVTFFISLLLAGCGGSGGGGSSNSCDTLNLRVSNGDNCSLRGSPVVPVMMLVDQGLASCTGTLVSLSSVLTAAHCVSDIHDISVITPGGIFTASEGGITGIYVHPSYTVNSQGITQYDVAVIKLAGSGNTSPVAVSTTAGLSDGERFTVFGYGDDGKGKGFYDRLDNEDYEELLKAGEMKVTVVESPLFVAEFNSTGQSICPGDSGGPAIKTLPQGPALVGISSFGTASNCTRDSIAAFSYLNDRNIIAWLRAVVPDLSTL